MQRTRWYALVLLAGFSCGCGLINPDVDANGIPRLVPKYVERAAVQPSVSPATFNSGPPFDWEDPAAQEPKWYTLPWNATFANTRTFEETTRWIKTTIETRAL